MPPLSAASTISSGWSAKAISRRRVSDSRGREMRNHPKSAAGAAAGTAPLWARLRRRGSTPTFPGISTLCSATEGMTMAKAAKLPPVTIIIEWENAIDVHDEWIDKAMAALARELESVNGRIAAKPGVTYLYDDKAVDPGVIRKTIARAAPRLPEVAELEIEPAPGLTYYKLKNYGVSRSKTEISVMLDSDAGPQPGWLENILKPFQDPEIVVVRSEEHTSEL